MLDLPMGILVVRLLLDIGAVGILLATYQRARPSNEASFTIVTLNLITFALAVLLSEVSIDLGVSLGLFAIFGILRYRTQALEVTDLTYIFLTIGLAVINGIGDQNIALAKLMTLNSAVVVSVVVLEWMQARNRKTVYSIRYDRLDLLAPGRREELVADLEKRLGQRLSRVSGGSLDMLMSTAEIRVETLDSPC